MKSLLAVFIFTVAVCQVFDSYAVVQAQKVKTLNITVFYETLSFEHLELYNQLVLNVNDPDIKDLLVIELVPFGNAYFTEFPWGIQCENGPGECYGNVMNACFFVRNPDFVKQVNFLSCCMHHRYPPHAGLRCARKFGYRFRGVRKCTRSEEGIDLQLKNGRRTLDFSPTLTSFPTIVFDNVFDAQDQQTAFVDLQAVIIRKLNAKGVQIVKKDKGGQTVKKEKGV